MTDLMANPVLAAFCESVNASRSGDPERMAAADAQWKEATKDLPPVPYDDREPEYDAYDYYDRKGRWPEGYRGPFPSWVE